ncbi:MarR family winged helix-turn-helix transcriptional regulator [Thermincola potens]|uniref:Transcriptional regulator, MarR family n=1 Tax=Thermincola potens (strain JR) TaxID=635013 RepID=D5XC65_THEPJ|nr:MarR family transcriptional regulator [Thermincola potens]ADG83517.1 transcriptional regulator, MarR family [Thermincola potens JR]
MDEKTYLAQELARTIAQFKRLGRPPGSSHGIRPSEFMLLVTLTQCPGADSEGLKVSDLSARMQITPAGVTHMINALEDGGYVERLADPTDRRVVLVKPTARAKQFIEDMNAKFLEDLKGLVGYLGEQDSKELIRLLSLALTYFRERRERNAE